MYILKNAKLLHTMTIKGSKGDLFIKDEMVINLLCKTRSPTCEILFLVEGSTTPPTFPPPFSALVALFYQPV